MSALRLVIFGLIAITASGCASTPVERQKDTARSLAEVRDGMAATEQQIDKTLESLNALMSAPPEKRGQAYAQYARDVDTLKKQTEQIRQNRTEMREQRDRWLSGWQDAQKNVQSPELKEISQERRAEIAARFDRVTQSADAASEAFTPLIRNLEDVKTVLGNDLSERGIDAVSRTNVVQNATANGTDVEQNLEAAVKDFDELLGTLYPPPK